MLKSVFKMKKFAWLIILLILIYIPIGVCQAEYNDRDYIIKKYDVDIKISSENVYEITETITADFFVSKHGIFRSIPMNYDGYKARIYDIYINEQYTQSKSGGNLVLKIGDPDFTMTGEKEYVIRYKFSLGEDRNENFDLFYFNIIGTGWDTTIKNIRFSLEFPELLNSGDVSFYIGSESEVYSDNVYHEINGRTVTGSVPILGAYEGLTARVVLPENTFIDVKTNSNYVYFSIAAWILCGLLMLFAWQVWNKKGRDPMLYPSVQFNPPENMTPAEVGYVIDGIVDNKDITSLIFYWADKGYIDISESGKNEFLFVKLKEPETENAFETFMFHRLFEYGNDGWVSTKDLKQEFYEDIPLIKTQVKEKFEGKKRLFTKESTVWSAVLFLLSAIPLLLLLIVLIEGFPSFEVIVPFAMTAAGVLISGAVIVQTLKKWNIYTRINKIVRSILFGMFILIFCIAFSVFSFALEEGFSPIYHTTGFIMAEAIRTAVSTFMMFVFSAATIKRTEYGHKQLEYLLGLKNFIKEAEMDKLRQMIDDNPAYFYNILPYAIVLGLEKKWAGKMKGITVPPPDYYRSSSGMPIASNLAVVSILRCINRTGFVMSVGKSSGKGGGFSGGGAGGGGGGSW